MEFSKDIPACPDPGESGDPSAYLRKLSAYDDALRAVAAQHLSHMDARDRIRRSAELPADTEIGFATTGSDARGEKGPPSLLEVIVLLRCDKISSGMRDSIKDTMGELLEHPVFERRPEIKHMQSGKLSYYNDDGKNLWPSRAVDAVAIDDASGPLTEAWREAVGEEARHLKRAKIIEAHDQRIKYARGITQTGRGKFNAEERVHFDMCEGVAFWQPEEQKNAFKQGPLRLLQMRIMRDCMIVCRRQHGHEGFIRDMPRSTAGKLGYLQKKSLLKAPESVDAVLDAYHRLLMLTHAAQIGKRRGAKAQPFDRSEVQAWLQEIVKYTEHPIITE